MGEGLNPETQKHLIYRPPKVDGVFWNRNAISDQRRGWVWFYRSCLNDLIFMHYKRLKDEGEEKDKFKI